MSIRFFHKCNYVSFGKNVPAALNYDIRSGTNSQSIFTLWTCTDNDCLPALYSIIYGGLSNNLPSFITYTDFG